MFDFVQTGVAALRSGRNKGNVSYANDEEGFGGAALSNTTLASEDEEEEDEFDNDEEDEDDEDEEEEEDSESEGEEDGDDEEEDSGSENKRAKKKQRFAAPNGENNKKRKRAENFGRNGIDNKVLADAKKKADEFNFKVGSGAYVALVVLLAGGAVGITSMNPTTIEEFARQLSLEGETKNGKKTKMAYSTIWSAMERDKTNFLRNEDGGTYFLADKLEKKKETKEKKETRGRFNVNRAEWDDTKFPGMHFHKDENKWCPLCNGRTVDRDGSFCHLLFFSLDYLWALTEELLERARGEVKMEDVRDSLHIYFQDKKFHVESGVENFDSFRRHVRHHDGIICHKCLNEAKSELKDQIEGR